MSGQDNHCQQKPARFFSILQQQQHSLEHFSYFPIDYNDEDHDPEVIRLRYRFTSKLDSASTGLAGFTALRRIEIHDFCPNLQEVLCKRDTAPPNMTSLRASCPDVPSLQIIPPNNPHQLLRSAWWQGKENWVVTACQTIPSLYRIELVADPGSSLKWASDSPTHRQTVKGLGKLLFSHYRHLRLYQEKSTRYKPPILYEEKPVENELVYSTYEDFSRSGEIVEEGRFWWFRDAEVDFANRISVDSVNEADDHWDRPNED
jgi:hypothetical protein